jgi:hypothetical protein
MKSLTGSGIAPRRAPKHKRTTKIKPKPLRAPVKKWDQKIGDAIVKSLEKAGLKTQLAAVGKKVAEAGTQADHVPAKVVRSIMAEKASHIPYRVRRSISQFISNSPLTPSPRPQTPAISIPKLESLSSEQRRPSRNPMSSEVAKKLKFTNADKEELLNEFEKNLSHPTRSVSHGRYEEDFKTPSKHRPITRSMNTVITLHPTPKAERVKAKRGKK